MLKNRRALTLLFIGFILFLYVINKAYKVKDGETDFPNTINIDSTINVLENKTNTSNQIEVTEIEQSETEFSRKRNDVKEVFDFEDFDNENGSENYVVPNVVHLIYLNLTSISFDYMITLYSIFLNQNPQKIYIHCDKCLFKDDYNWQQIQATKCLNTKLVVHPIPSRDTIFNAKIKWPQHR